MVRAGKETAAKSKPEKKVGVVRKVAGGLVAGALKGVASVVEKVAGIDEGNETSLSREIAGMRDEVAAARTNISEELDIVREEVGNVNEQVAQVADDIEQVKEKGSK
jgi:hypothetical protein